MKSAETDPIELTEDEQRIYERLEDVFEEERRRIAKALAGAGSQLFGRAEYELRDQVQRLTRQSLGSGRRRAAKKGMDTKELA